MIYSFEIRARLPGLNEIIDANRAHRMKGAKQKKDSDRLCMQYIQMEKVPSFAGPVKVHFDWFLNDARDPDNIRTGVKFILDALVQMKCLVNDNRKYIKGLSDSFTEDKLNPRVRVTISE